MQIQQGRTEFLLRAYQEEPARKEGADPRIFSALINGHSKFSPETGRCRPQVPHRAGNPILGDGKSDNQNHAIIFYRSEYLQLIDANQDNYLEECLNIRNILAEFEEFVVPNRSPYGQWNHRDFRNPPVAIVGTREYIFSQIIGILGEVWNARSLFNVLGWRQIALWTP